MLIRWIKSQGGYSLVEVMVAILILAVAIIPMVSMFDAGLRAAVLGSNYDRARALGNEKLEDVRALPYKRPGGSADSVVELYDPASPSSLATGTVGNFNYNVQTRYVDATLLNPTLAPATPQMQVTVEVRWDGNTKSYKTTGFVAGG